MSSNLIPIPTEAELAPKTGVIKKIGGLLFSTAKAITGVNDRLDLSGFLQQQKVCIVDVGARFGFHERWEQLGKNLRIVLFEPNKEGYQELLDQYKNDERAVIHNTALAEREGDIEINLAAFPYSSSAFKHDDDFFARLNFRDFYKDVDILKIAAKRLDDVLKDPFDFIKLDVEGYELSILKSAGSLLDTCVGIEAEVSYNSWAKGLPLFGDVDAFCKSRGFILCKLSPPAHYHYILPDRKLEAQGIVFSGDALYFRDPYFIIESIKTGKWQKEKLFPAAAMYLAYGHYEFAYVLLDEACRSRLADAQGPAIKEAMGLISRRSGWKRSFSIAFMKRLKKLCRVASPEGLDH